MSGSFAPGLRLLSGWFQPDAAAAQQQPQQPEWIAFISQVFGGGAGEDVHGVLQHMVTDLSQDGFDISEVLENPLALIPSEDNGLGNYASAINKALEDAVKIQNGMVLYDAEDDAGNTLAQNVANGSNNFVVITPDRVYRVDRFNLDQYSAEDVPAFIVPFYNAILWWYFVERSSQGEFPNFISKIYRVYKKTNLTQAPLTLDALNANGQMPGFDEDAGICQELENAGIDVHSYMLQEPHADTVSIVKQALLILYRMYEQQNIIHGDAKSDNMTIMLNEPCTYTNPRNREESFAFEHTIKLIDFDISCIHHTYLQDEKGTFQGGTYPIQTVCNTIAQDVLLFCYSVNMDMISEPAFPSDGRVPGIRWETLVERIELLKDLYVELANAPEPRMRSILGLGYGVLTEDLLQQQFLLNFIRSCFSQELKDAIRTMISIDDDLKDTYLGTLLRMEEMFLPQNVSEFLGLW